jgi:AcrR family transcriptional regulator
MMVAEKGASLSTEDVALRADVGIGTVFRHFPTKEPLLRAVAIMRLEQLTKEARELAVDDGGALFRFFERVVEQAARKTALLHALSSLGVDLPELLDEGGRGFRQAVRELLKRAQGRRLVRDDVDVRDVLYLLLALAHAAGQGSRKVRSGALAVVLDGLRYQRVGGRAGKVT